MGILERIENRQAVVSVIGLGYVGLPLCVAFAEAGFRVVGIDSDQAKVESITRGESYIPDAPSETLARLALASAEVKVGAGPNFDAGQSNGLSATTDYDVLRDVDVVLVCVPTPLGKTKEPDLTYVVAAINEIAERLHQEVLVVIESTIYPGATQELILPRLQSANGGEFTVGTDFFLAFSPERIDPGRRDWTVQNIPKVVGGATPQCLEVARALYQSTMQEVVPVSSSTAAEMTKLLENTFRAVNIALVNEFAMICDRLGLDVWEVIDAAKTKPFGFMPFYPGPGLGGHCLPVDPHYLSWKLNALDYDARLINLAMKINQGMPEHVLRMVSDSLNEIGKPLKDSRILVLGVAYKAEVAELRDSPALDVIRLLQGKGARVSYHDPFIPLLQSDTLSMTSITLDRGALQDADCVVIIANHSSYDWVWIVENSRLVVDTRNATQDVQYEPGRVVKL